MPLRDIFITVVIIGLLPSCLFRPYFGILVWSWLGYMNPHKLCWGFARFLPFAFIVAICVLLGLVTAPDAKRRGMPMFRETWMLLGLWAMYTVSTIFSWYPNEAWPHLWKVSKILLFTFLTLFYFQDRKRLRTLFMVLALSIGFYGLKGGIWVFRTGALGTSAVLGPEGTFIGGNTEIGLALNMTLPFLLILGREEPRRWLKRLMFTAFGFSILAIMFTYSRGAILGLPVVLMMLFLRARRKFFGIFAIVILGYFVMLFPPPEWFTRVQSINEYQQDRSSRMRLESWYVAWRLVLDHPLTGVGFWTMDHDEVFSLYLTDYIRAQSAHSIWFQMMADHGFPGFFLFVGVIVSSYITMFGLKFRARGRPEAKWVGNYCQMIEASLMGFLVSGSFLSQSYWDLFYHLISFVILLKAVAIQEGVLTAPIKQPAPAPYWAVRPAQMPSNS
jgi:putative inorganic carbon (hco3(-)) transporter